MNTYRAALTYVDAVFGTGGLLALATQKLRPGVGGGRAQVTPLLLVSLCCCCGCHWSSCWALLDFIDSADEGYDVSGELPLVEEAL